MQSRRGRRVTVARLREALASSPRDRLATLPTPLEPAGSVADLRLFLKRDDLTGLALGGNKARKLEFLVADARATGADLLVTVGAAQSNHARMTAAAGARAGLETHLVLGGDPPARAAGNQLIAELCGAHLHFAGTHDWAALEQTMDGLVEAWRAAGRAPYPVPIGGSTPAGARGFALAWLELADQCAAADVRPQVIVHASSSAGTHAGLLAGRAVTDGPDVLAVAVAGRADDLAARARRLADQCLGLLGLDVEVAADDVHVDPSFQGRGYAVPTDEADEAIRWAARRGGWILDRTYTGKAFAGLLDHVRRGRIPPGDVVFWHTGGQPALFAPGGAPEPGVAVDRRR